MADAFADGIFKCFLFNRNIWILNIISMKFFHKGPIENVTTGSGDGLALNGQHAITWNNNTVQWCIMRHPSSMS